MRLNKGKNIDMEVCLPPDLEFRAEKVWSKIEKKDSKLRIFSLLLGAIISAAAFLVFFLWTPETKKSQVDDRILVTGLTRVPANPKLDLEGFKLIKQGQTRTKMKISPENVEVSEVNLPNLEKSEAPIVVAKSSQNLPFEPLKSIKSEENANKKSLSPAALILKKNLSNSKNELVADRILIQEKFKLKNELAVLGLDKSNENTTGTVFESLKKNSYAKN